MVFTPLLTSACVGTLDLRSVAVPVMSLQKHLREPQNNYFLGSADNIDPKKKTVHCKDEDGTEFDIAYDKLVIATGSQVVKHACICKRLLAPLLHGLPLCITSALPALHCAALHSLSLCLCEHRAAPLEFQELKSTPTLFVTYMMQMPSGII